MKHYARMMKSMYENHLKMIANGQALERKHEAKVYPLSYLDMMKQSCVTLLEALWISIVAN